MQDFFLAKALTGMDGFLPFCRIFLEIVFPFSGRQLPSLWAVQVPRGKPMHFNPGEQSSPSHLLMVMIAVPVRRCPRLLGCIRWEPKVGKCWESPLVIDQDQDDDQCILYLSYGYTHMLDPVDADLFIELELWRLKMWPWRSCQSTQLLFRFPQNPGEVFFESLTWDIVQSVLAGFLDLVNMLFKLFATYMGSHLRTLKWWKHKCSSCLKSVKLDFTLFYFQQIWFCAAAPGFDPNQSNGKLL